MRFANSGAGRAGFPRAPGVALLALFSIAPASSQQWVTTVEAWTAIDERSTIIAAPRLFSAPDLTDTCVRAATPARLIAPARVVLRRGRPFEFSSLRIRATDLDGRTLPPVPIAIETDGRQGEWLSPGSQPVGSGAAIPLRVGSFRFRARTLCSIPTTEVVIRVVVVGS